MIDEQEAGTMNPKPPLKRAVLRLLNWEIVLRLILAGLLMFHAVAYAPVAYAEDARKIKSSVPPEYPELARRLNIKGMARVQATVMPDGAVKEVRELGGNPVLVEALARAVKKWRYEPADRTSLIEVRFEFTPQ